MTLMMTLMMLMMLMTLITSYNPADHVISRRARKLLDVESIDMFAETPDKNRNDAAVTDELHPGVGDTAGTEGFGGEASVIMIV